MKQEALMLKEKLGEMAVLYGRFRDLLTLEQHHLVSGSTHDLAETVHEKEKTAALIQAAEEERIALVERIGSAFNLGRRSIKVDDIAARLDKEDARELLNARTALTTVVAQVKGLNDVNNQLLKDSMEYVKGAFEIVTGKQDRRQGYGMTGRIRTSVNVKRNLVNTRA